MVLGLTPDDLEKLKLDNIDIIAALGKWKEWSKDQVCGVCCLFRLYSASHVFFVCLLYLINYYPAKSRRRIVRFQILKVIEELTVRH